MKNFLMVALMLGLLVSCKNETTAPRPDVTKETPAATKDQKEIEKLVRDMYYWVENMPSHRAWHPFIKDSMIVGYDRIGQSLYTKSMYESGYFATEFMDNMAKIFNTQDELLRSGKVEWHENDLPPFHGDTNPWCNCQDGELSEITLHFEKIDASTATFYWNREGQDDPGRAKHHYHMRTIKEGGKWKVSYMEGWDYEANTKPEY